MDKCREEFEKQKYWIGLFRDAVDFDEELGRYVLNGQRKLYAFHLDSFNEKWVIWQGAWQHQQAKVEELQNNINLLNEALDIKEQLNQKLREREDELQKRVDAALKETQFALQYVEEDMRGNHEFLQMAMIRTLKALEQALKGGA